MEFIIILNNLGYNMFKRDMEFKRCKPDYFGAEQQILKFYEQFPNYSSLIRWLRNVKKKEPKIIVKKSKITTVIAVIPTRYTKNIRGLKKKYGDITLVIAVNQKDTGHFNYAYSINKAINEALKMKPSWLIIANDDIKDVGKTKDLVRILGHIDNKCTDVVFPEYITKYPYTHEVVLVKYRFYSGLLLRIIRKKTFVKYILHKKYGIKIFAQPSSWRERLVFKKIHCFTNIGDFSIISPNFIKNNKNKLFDDIFLNGNEDTEVSLKFRASKIEYINYKMNCGYGGNSLGHNQERFLRDIATQCYIYHKYLKNKYKS